jgi:stearoyl-CoA desaturase (delta-9 desaturase)
MIVYILLLTHITIACVTLFLHRSQAHRSVKFDSRVEHFMRFWLWLTTGMVTKQWVAIHRKHRFTDVNGDPHSPQVYGVWQILLGGAFYYASAAKDCEMVKAYGAGTPNDWLEQNVYTPFNWLGITIMFFINSAIFGWAWGWVPWLWQMIWIPLWAAGVVNGLGHWWGYRNTETKDTSTNLVPWGIIIGGEELHNNHHADPASARLSMKPWEFDLGWLYITLLQRAGLAEVRPTSAV